MHLGAIRILRDNPPFIHLFIHSIILLGACSVTGIGLDTRDIAKYKVDRNPSPRENHILVGEVENKQNHENIKSII